MAGSEKAKSLGAEFLRVSRHEIAQRLSRIEDCVSRLTAEQIWSRGSEVENSIGNLMLHLAGNLRQWIVAGVGGSPDTRDRDAEFARRDPVDVEELLRVLRGAIEEADGVLAGLTDGELLTMRRIQAYEVTVLHAVNHVVDHFSEHTGQIIWATKRMTVQDLGFYGDLKGALKPDGSRTP